MRKKLSKDLSEKMYAHAKSSKKVSKLISVILCTALITGVIVVNNNGITNAEEEPIKVTLSQLQGMAVDNSIAIKDLNTQIEGMNDSLKDFENNIGGLKVMYAHFPRFKELTMKESITNSKPEYKDYLTQQIIVSQSLVELETIEARLAVLYAIVEGDRTAEELAEITVLEGTKAAINASVATLATMKNAIDSEKRDEILTFNEFMKLEGLKMQFSFIGVYSGFIPKDEEYNKFIKPIYVSEIQIKMGIDSLSNAVNIARVNTQNGVTQLYKALLSLKGYYNIQSQAAEQKEIDIDILNRKIKYGLVTQNQIKKAENELKIAELEANKLHREIENLEMNMKLMAGIKLTAEIELVNHLRNPVISNNLEYYLEKALVNRTEIVGVDVSLKAKTEEFNYVKEYFEEDDFTYKITLNELEQLKKEKALIEKEIQQEIIIAYQDTEQKLQQKLVDKLAYEEAQRQYKELETNYKLGYITKAMLEGFEVLELQKQITYHNSIVDYNLGIMAIENASDLGPAYK